MDTVEHYNCFSKKKHDLFNMFDVLVVGKGETVGIQITSYSNVSARVKKITGMEDRLDDLREAGWKILVHGWRKVKGRYQVREVDLS